MDFDLSGIVGIILNYVAILMFLAVAAGLLYFANMKGLLVKRPYTLRIYSRRANDSVKEISAKGRFLKSGKFEIWYGMNEKSEEEAPGEEFIDDGNVIRFFRQTRDSHFPIKLSINSDVVTADPSFTNAAKMAVFRELEENRDRFNNDPLMKYAPYFALVIGFFIIGIALYVSNSAVADSMNQVASGFSGVAEALKDAEVIITKEPPPG